MTPDETLDVLPPFMHELVDVVGIDAALRLVEWRGGVGVYVPREAVEGSDLVNCMGVEAAKKLCEVYQGTWIRMPRCRSLLLARRNDLIRADRVAGLSSKKLALKYKLTQRQIWNVVREIEAEDDAQQSLFTGTTRRG